MTKTTAIKAAAASKITPCQGSSAYDEPASVALRQALTQDWEDRGFESQEDCLADDFGGLCEEDTLVDFELEGRRRRGVYSPGTTAEIIFIQD